MMGQRMAGVRRRILTSSYYPVFYRGHQRIGPPAFLSMMRLRKIWAEGSFSVLKREYCISKIRKRGIPAATEECLLAAMALNLKRMAKVISYKLKILFNWTREQLPRPVFFFCQQVQFLALADHHKDTNEQHEHNYELHQSPFQNRGQSRFQIPCIL